MRITVRKVKDRTEVYVARKDLETWVVSQEKEGLWGGKVTLENGWVMVMPDLPPDTKLPITIDARKLGEE